MKKQIKNKIKSIVGASLIGLGAILPFRNANAQFYSLSCANISDNNINFANGADELVHLSSGQEGYDSNDGSWTNRGPPYPMQNKEMKIVSLPYGVELRTDSRPTNSQTMFHMELSAVDRNNSSAILNTDTNRIKMNINNTLNTNKLWIAKLHRNATNNPSGQDIDMVTNIVTAAGGYTFGKNFYFNLPGITNLLSGTTNGYVDVINVYTNQYLGASGNRTSKTNAVNLNQVDGLEYKLLSSTSGAGTNYILNGTNLVFNPDNGFVGTNNANVQLSWVNGGVTNVLGTINWQYAVTNQPAPNTAPTISDMSINASRGPVGTSFTNAVPTSDSDGTITNVALAQAPTNGYVNFDHVTNAVYTFTNSAGIDSSGKASDYFRLYSVDNMGAKSNTNQVWVTLTNTPPVVGDISRTLGRGQTVTNPVVASDPDGTIAGYAVAVSPTNGTLTLDGTNAVYHHFLTNGLADYARLRVTDDSGASVTNSVAFTITNYPYLNVTNYNTVRLVGTNRDVMKSALDALVSSPNGFPVTAYAVDSTSSNGVPITDGDTYVRYGAVANGWFDLFRRRYVDGAGVLGEQTISVTAYTNIPGRIIAGQLQGNSIDMIARLVPYGTYDVLEAGDLKGNWTSFTNVTADADGLSKITRTFTNGVPNRMFYQPKYRP